MRQRMENALQLQLAWHCPCESWYRNEFDNLKAGCVSTNCARARLPQDMATTDLNVALDLTILILLRGLAWNTSDNPLVFYSHQGKYPPARRSPWFTVLIVLSHQWLSPVEEAAPFSGPPSPTEVPTLYLLLVWLWYPRALRPLKQNPWTLWVHKGKSIGSTRKHPWEMWWCNTSQTAIHASLKQVSLFKAVSQVGPEPGPSPPQHFVPLEQLQK